MKDVYAELGKYTEAVPMHRLRSLGWEPPNKKGKKRRKSNPWYKKQQLLSRLVKQGIPVAFRGTLYFVLSGGSRLKEIEDARFRRERGTGPSARETNGYYGHLLERCAMAPGEDGKGDGDNLGGKEDPGNGGPLRDKIKSDIDKDIYRTFPGHPMFEKESKNNPNITSLKNVLQCFALRHQATIGYCQSLNFLVASLMLLGMEEEELFYTLCAFVEKILPAEYFSPKLYGMHVDQRILINLIRLKLPDVFALFKENGIDVRVITLQWFMCSFVNTLPTETAFRVWDRLMCLKLEEAVAASGGGETATTMEHQRGLHASSVLFKVSLALLRLSADDALKLIEARKEKRTAKMKTQTDVEKDLNESFDLHDDTTDEIDESKVLFMAVQNAGKVEFDIARLFFVAFDENLGERGKGKKKPSLLNLKAALGKGKNGSGEGKASFSFGSLRVSDVVHLRTECRKLVTKEFQELQRRRDKYAAQDGNGKKSEQLATS